MHRDSPVSFFFFWLNEWMIEWEPQYGHPSFDGSLPTVDRFDRYSTWLILLLSKLYNTKTNNLTTYLLCTSVRDQPSILAISKTDHLGQGPSNPIPEGHCHATLPQTLIKHPWTRSSGSSGLCKKWWANEFDQGWS